MESTAHRTKQVMSGGPCSSIPYQATKRNKEGKPMVEVIAHRFGGEQTPNLQHGESRVHPYHILLRLRD